MHTLCIYSLDKTYEISLMKDGWKIDSHCNQDLSSNLLPDCKQILGKHKIIKPNEIHTLSGPGSFTSTRFTLAAAQTLTTLWEIQLKTCTIMECIEKEYPKQNLQLILPTGTPYWFVYTLPQHTHQLTLEPDIDFSQAWISNSEKLSANNHQNNHQLPFPDLTPLMHQICLNKEHQQYPQPFYAIQPSYLKTETEISKDKRDFDFSISSKAPDSSVS